jgi:hypothetical protein
MLTIIYYGLTSNLNPPISVITSPARISLSNSITTFASKASKLNPSVAHESNHHYDLFDAFYKTLGLTVNIS